ncbi:exo-alpha-sialidase [Nocardioides sp. CBS4Y-1]|uniref:Exo-alpha-sialidase n=2 Tax=Nocardioides acrostichi TaxID=2784339 RepID=A0A930UWI3_9ACTN|nr:exo-alpha-sialidase [Nocardioides acrostichi]
MVGTRKGLWIGTSDEFRREWDFTGPHHDMEEVYSCLIDTRGERPRLLAGASSPWLGALVRRSDDLGETWVESSSGPVAFPDDVDASVERIWQLAAGTEAGVVHAGTEPGAIFTSTDGGETFGLERALWDHPHRTQWNAGFGGQAFHTILPHPTDSTSLTAAISTGGVYQTTDQGCSWSPANQGLRAVFLPEGQQFPEFGQCVHKVARHPARPERMYLQNHGGVYRTDDEGVSWTSIADGLPSDFGFPMVVHPHDPDTIFCFPLSGGEGRYPVDAEARVWRSRDAGDTWEALGAGDLPDSFHVAVMRDAMDADSHDVPGLYFGARNGAVWGSADTGETWSCLVRDLPDVMCVRAAAI